MPSVEILENAIEFLFQWLKVTILRFKIESNFPLSLYLKERYVNTYKEIAIERSMLQNVKLYIQNLIVDYMNVRYKVIKYQKIKF